MSQLEVIIVARRTMIRQLKSDTRGSEVIHYILLIACSALLLHGYRTLGRSLTSKALTSATNLVHGKADGPPDTLTVDQPEWPDADSQSPTRDTASAAERAAEWAENARSRQDSRFFDSHTNSWGEWLRNPRGYAKCNQFVAAAFREGAGVDYPSVAGRAPLVEELARPSNFRDKLSYSASATDAKPGTIVIWYDRGKGVHHSGIITGRDTEGHLLVTYAGAGDEIRQRTVDAVTAHFGVQPVFRAWRN